MRHKVSYVKSTSSNFGVATKLNTTSGAVTRHTGYGTSAKTVVHTRPGSTWVTVVTHKSTGVVRQEQKAKESYSQPQIPLNLQRKHHLALIQAREYRRKFGDPINNLASLLDEAVLDDELWHEIVDEPYG